MPELTLDDATRQRYLNIVHEETHKLEAIIGDLLDLARLEGGADTLKPTTVNVTDLFGRIADRHGPAMAERGILLANRAARSLVDGLGRRTSTRAGAAERGRKCDSPYSARRPHRPSRRARGRSHSDYRDR